MSRLDNGPWTEQSLPIKVAAVPGMSAVRVRGWRAEFDRLRTEHPDMCVTECELRAWEGLS